MKEGLCARTLWFMIKPVRRTTILNGLLLLVVGCGCGEAQTRRVPSIPDGRLLNDVEPAYPRAAIERHIQGEVRIGLVIGKDGRVESARLISGHPLLRKAAVEAARQRVYRPFLVDGQPVRIATAIGIRFRLDEAGRPVRRAGAAGGRYASIRSR